MNVVQNTPLRPLIKLGDDDGWETSVGQAFKTIFYTGNYFAAYSGDDGQTYRSVSPFNLAQSVGHRFCCDQRAHYVPAANTMVWILLADDGPVLMCLASPDEVVNSQGKSWTVYALSGPVFSRARNTEFDYPQISFGDNFLYLTFNFFDTGDAIVCRFHVGQLRERGTLNFQYFVAINNNFICPSQLSGDRGLFVVQNTTSQLRVFEWQENSNTILPHDVNIATIPTEDWVIQTPDGSKWLEPGSKINTTVQGAARSGMQLWAAWTGARKVQDRRENSFPHPHIGIAVINVQTMKLVQQRYLWNNEHAFAYPSLASNPNGEVALTFMWGGDRHYVQHGVGFLTGQTELTSTTNSKSITGGGHYITARMAFPIIDRFIAAGSNSPKDTTKPTGYENHPRYVLFHR
jgi:hypothetical protein